MEISDIRKALGLENLDPEDIDRIKLQLQQLNDTIRGGLRSANLAEYRNTYVINAQDSLDATYPMYVHFNIISEMTKIVSIKLSFWFLNFRAYSTAAKSGGGSTSGSGGGQTSSSVTTPSGGGATSGAMGSASGGGSTTPSGGGSTTPSGGGSTSGSGGQQTSSGLGALAAESVGIEGGTGYINAGLTGYALFDTASYNILYNHTHTVANHTHSTPAHIHTTPNHIHSTPDHTHPNHTHSTPDHTHPAHDHTVANHTHSTPDHTHDIAYGIHEEENSPTVMVYISRDNGLTYSLPIGSYTKDQETLDITRFIDKAGSKMIKFESNARARLSVQIEIKLDIKAR